MKTNGAFARGFWQGFNAPLFFFDAIGRGAERSSSSRHLAVDWNGVIDVLLGRNTRRDSLNPATRTIANRMARQLERMPSPQALEDLERVFPGGADRLMKLFEQDHVDRLERRRLNFQKSGQALWMGFALVILSIAAGVATALQGCPWQVSVAFVSVPLLGVVRAFVPLRNSTR